MYLKHTTCALLLQVGYLHLHGPDRLHVLVLGLLPAPTVMPGSATVTRDDSAE